MEVDRKIIAHLERQDHVTIGLSMGKDSLACALILRSIGIKYTPFYFYQVPELEFVNKQIEYYQDTLNIEIVQLPHPMLYDHIRHQDFQRIETANYIAGFRWGKMTFEKLIGFWLDENNIDETPYDIVGMRASESMNRRKYFEKFGPIREDKRKVYPIYNWKKQQTKDFVTKSGIKLSDDYNIWDRSFDGIKYQFLFGVKKHYPEDFERIKEYFPLIEAELKRYEFNQRYYVNLG